MSSYENDSNNLVIEGQGQDLLITDGYGDSDVDLQPEDGPEATITDYVERGKALFITQFRQTREE